MMADWTPMLIYHSKKSFIYKVRNAVSVLAILTLHFGLYMNRFGFSYFIL